MVDELINTITQKTGLSTDKAQAAAQAVLDFLKTRLPASMSGALDKAVSGGANAADAGGGMLGNAAEKVGSMFGKNK